MLRLLRARPFTEKGLLKSRGSLFLFFIFSLSLSQKRLVLASLFSAKNIYKLSASLALHAEGR